jgi:predicted kinase
MHLPKVILINGAAAVGKSTIGRRYLNDHPLTLNIEGDDLIGMIGHWLTHEPEARRLVYEFTCHILSIHLQAGHDVLIPYLPQTADHAARFEKISKENGAAFIEIELFVDKTEAWQRLKQRGTWGEKDSPPLTEADRSIADNLYDNMTTALQSRPNTVRINAPAGDPDGTYQQFLQAVQNAAKTLQT